MNSAKWLDESIFNFTLFGKFGRWVLFVFEGCTLTIPRLPSGGLKMAKSGNWGRLHIKNPPTAVGGFKEVRLHCGFGLQRTEGGGFARIGRRS
jgi:hypothetical protein